MEFRIRLDVVQPREEASVHADRYSASLVSLLLVLLGSKSRSRTWLHWRGDANRGAARPQRARPLAADVRKHGELALVRVSP